MGEKDKQKQVTPGPAATLCDTGGGRAPCRVETTLQHQSSAGQSLRDGPWKPRSRGRGESKSRRPEATEGSPLTSSFYQLEEGAMTSLKGQYAGVLAETAPKGQGGVENP